MDTEDWQVPSKLHLTAMKPTAAPSLIRRHKAVQSPSAVVNSEGAEIIIPIDTATPAAFIDCDNSYLMFTLTITNTNPYIDYVNFGPAGAASFIEKIQIRSANTAIEEIQQYAEIFTIWLEMEGTAQEEFHVYKSRCDAAKTGWQWGGGDGNINLVKAPMVDWNGRIMGACTYQNLYQTHGTQEHNITTSQRGNTNNSGNPQVPTTERGLFFPEGHQFNYQNDTLNINLWPLTIGVEPPQGTDKSYTQLNNRNARRTQDYTNFLSNTKSIPIGCYSTLGIDPLTGVFTPVTSGNGTVANTNNFENDTSYTPGIYQATVCMPLVSGILGLMAEKYFPSCICQDLQIVITLSTAAKAMQVTMDPCRRIVGTRRDYCVYHGQVLGGIYGAATSSATGYPATPAYYAPGAGKPDGTYNPTVPFADYSVPDTNMGIVQNMNCFTQYGQNGYFAQFSNYLNGLAGGPQNVQSATTTDATTFTAPSNVEGYLGSYSCCSTINASNSNGSAAVTFSGTPAWIPSSTSTAPGRVIYPPANGTVYGGQSFPLNYASFPTAAGTPTAAQFYPMYEGAIQYDASYPRWPYAGYSFQDKTGGGNTYAPNGPAALGTGSPDWMNSWNPNWMSYCAQGKMPQYFIPSWWQSTTSLTGNAFWAASGVVSGATGTIVKRPFLGSSALCYQNQGLAYTANILPFITTSNYNGSQSTLSAASYIGAPNLGNEASGAYGTYLKASVPQSRRCIFNWDKGSAVTGTTLQEYNLTYAVMTYPKYFNNQQVNPTFGISNVEFVTQYILLPDQVSGEIIAAAIEDALVMETHTIKVYPYISSSSGSATQNLQPPIKIGVANTLGFIFRHASQVTGTNQILYDSLHGSNPFGAVVYTHDTQSYLGTNNVPKRYDMSASGTIGTTANSWNYQLAIGSDNVPNTPVKNVTEHNCENEKATHGLWRVDNGNAQIAPFYTRQIQNYLGYGTFVPSPATQAALGTGAPAGVVVPASGGISSANCTVAGEYLPTFSAVQPYCVYSSFSASNQKPDWTYVDIESDGGAFTVYQDVTFLMDQTITNNSNWRYYTNGYGNDPRPNQDMWVPVAEGAFKIRGFVPAYSTYRMMFELDSFSGLSDVTSSGRYLGDNGVILRMEGARMFEAYPGLVNVTAYVYAEAIVSIEAGGVVRMFL